MLPSDATSPSMVYQGKHQQPPNGGDVNPSISQQLLFKLGGGGGNGRCSGISSNNVAHLKSTLSCNNSVSLSGRCHSKHDPIMSFASHIVQTLFGNVVQIVADCLQCRGTLSLREIVAYLIPRNNSDSPAAKFQSQSSKNGTSVNCSSTGRNNRSGSSSSQLVLTLPQIKGALLVLIQHSIVSTTTKRSNSNTSTATTPSSKEKTRQSTTSTTLYRYHPVKAIYMNHRYAKFIEYIRKAMAGTVATDNTNKDLLLLPASVLVEELLLFGRLRTIDLIVYTIQRITKSTIEETSSMTAPSSNVSQQQQQKVIDALSKLVSSGFIVPSRVSNDTTSPDDDVEHEWIDTDDDKNSSNAFRQQKRFRQGADYVNDLNTDNVDVTVLYHGDALSVATLLTYNNALKHILPIDTVWTVNIPIFHDHLRAYYYGKYISERYGLNHFRGSNHGTNQHHQQQQSLFSCIGSLVTAALKYRAYRTYALTNDSSTNNHGVSYFTVADIMKFIPKSVLQMIEKKNEGIIGAKINVETSIQQIFCDVCSMDYHPHFLRRISESYHDSSSGQSQKQMAFEVVLQTISIDYIDRIIYQIVYDRHGAIAARVVSILSAKGYLESDRIADMAMIPAKDTREVLHHLYRSRYIEVLQLSNSSRQQYNPSNTIYLWGIERTRLIQRMIDDTAKAIHNIRLRRQHEIDTIGAEWLERMNTNHQQHPFSHDNTNNFTAKVGDVDLNIASAIDQENYTKFCTGLERLDVASIHLDETLMALFDFPK